MSSARGVPSQYGFHQDDPDFVPPSLPKTNGRVILVILEDNEAVIKMILKGRNPTQRHVGRTHRIDLDWLIENTREDPSMNMKYVNTKKQIADVFTKGQFSSQLWASLMNYMMLKKTREASS